MIPENILQQLTNWRFLPEDFQSLSGDPISLEQEWETVEEFLGQLQVAISKSSATIRETELDRAGGFQKAILHYEDELFDSVVEVFVDRLGRIILPASEPAYRALRGVTFMNGSESSHEVVKIETRYQGEEEQDLVLYLEAKPKEETDEA
jgi:hypothetical protein